MLYDVLSELKHFLSLEVSAIDQALKLERAFLIRNPFDRLILSPSSRNSAFN